MRLNLKGFHIRSTKTNNVSTVSKPVSKPVNNTSNKTEAKNENASKPLSAQAKNQLKAESNIQGTAKQADLEGKYAKRLDGKWQKVGDESSEITGHDAKLGGDYEGEKYEAKFRKHDAKPPGGVNKTEYYSPKQQKQHQIGVKNGKIVDSRGNFLDTTGAKGGLKDADNDRMIFAMKDGKIQAADARKEMTQHYENLKNGKTKDMNFVHHSSFFRGENVQGAGDMEVKNGELKTISNNSGHYTPNVETGLQTLQTLQKQGVNTDNVKYQIYTRDENKNVRQRTRYASEVMASKGNVQQIDNKIVMLDELRSRSKDVDNNADSKSKNVDYSPNMKPSEMKDQYGKSPFTNDASASAQNTEKTENAAPTVKNDEHKYEYVPASVKNREKTENAASTAKNDEHKYEYVPASVKNREKTENAASTVNNEHKYEYVPASVKANHEYDKSPVSIKEVPHEYIKSPVTAKESSKTDGFSKSSVSEGKERNPRIRIGLRA